jgi:hypothetical protein
VRCESFSANAATCANRSDEPDCLFFEQLDACFVVASEIGDQERFG